MTQAPRTDLDEVAREQADEELARIVRCPACRGSLERLASGARGFRCPACPAVYPEDEQGILHLVPQAFDERPDSPRTEKIRRRYDREALLYDLGFRFAARLVFKGDLDHMRALGRRAGETRVALDLPAGTGFFLPVPTDGTALVVGADLSTSMLRKARARLATDHARLARTRLVRADVMRLPFERGSFDAVSCVNGLHVFPDAAGAARELARVRAEHGLALGCSIILPAFGPRRAVARVFTWRHYMTTLFQERDLRRILVESGLAREGEIVRKGYELYWESRA